MAHRWIAAVLTALSCAVALAACASSHGPGGPAALDVNEAPARVLLARICSVTSDQPLCVDPVQALAFVQLLETTRGILPGEVFEDDRGLLEFAEGRGDPYEELRGLLGPDNPLLRWTPLELTAALRLRILDALRGVAPQDAGIALAP